MKKVLVLILSMALMACNPVPQSWTVTIIGLKDEPEIITVQQGENYRFVLPEDALFNRVFVNEVEVQLDANHEYLIEDIQTDIQITFNRQHTIILEQGVGYELVIVDDHQVVNEGQHVMFQLILDDDYDQSEPKVYINNIQTVLTDFEFEVEAVMSNLMITVRNVIRNPESPSIESPVAPPVETPVESPVESPIEPPKPNYGQYSNRDLSWWYRIPSPLNLGVQPTIEADIARLLQQYNGLWLKPATKKVIYLTMDEGYEYEQNTEQILDIAKVKQVPIMFFVTGSYVQRNPQLVQRMVKEGHVVANHTDRHLRAAPALDEGTEVFIQDIKQLEEKYRDLMGQEIAKFYRPPEGGYSERSLKIAQDLGYTTVFWSFAYRDWLVDAQPDLQQAYEQIMGQLHPGSIMLLHAVSVTNVQLLERLIDDIRAQGYVFDVLK